MSTRDPGRIAVTGAGALFAAIGLLFAGIGVAKHFNERGEARRLDADGKFTSALVTRKYIEANATQGRAKPSFHVQFRFAPAGQSEVSGSSTVTPQAYQRAKPGGRIEILYLPDTPSIHRVEGEVRDTLLGMVFAGIGGIFVLFGGGMIYAMLRRPRPQAARPGLFARVGIFVTRAPILLFAGVWLVVGLALLVAGWLIAAQERDMRAQFANESLPTGGTVLSKSVFTESSGSGNSRTQTTRYRIVFRYTVDGDEIVGTSNISSGAWERLVEHGPVNLSYVAGAPWRYRIDGEDGWSDWIGSYVMLGLGILGTAIGVIALAFAHPQLPSWAHTALWPRVSRRRQRAELGAPSVPQVPLPSRMPKLASAAQSLPRGWFMWAFGAIFFLAGVGAVTNGILTLLSEWRYARGSALAEGRITGKSIVEASATNRQSTKHVVTYRFITAQGEPHEGRQGLRWDAWEAAKEGGRIAVRYLIDAPQINREANADDTVTGFVTLGLGPLLGGIGGGILLLLYHRRQRRARLLRHGLSAAATVVAVEDSGFRVNKVMQQRIRFRFQDHNGRDREGTSEPMPPEAANDWTVGDTCEVRYDAANPDDHLWTGERRSTA